MEQLPPSLAIAKDVTEEEYFRARKQKVILMIATFGSAMLGAVAWFMGLRFSGLLFQGVILGVTTYFVLQHVLKDAAKMSTMKMQRYKELRLFRKSKAEFERKKTEEKGEG